MTRPRIAIATGDPAGIGPEVALKAALDPRVLAVCQPLLVGDRGVLELHARACGLSPRILAFDRIEAALWDDRSVCLLERQQLKPGELKLGQIDAAHGRAALDSAATAIKAAMSGNVHAVVGAPHTEKAIALAGIPFDGYPSFVARTTGVDPDNAVLMICWKSTRIAHVTLHVSLRRAIELITRERVCHVIETTDEALRKLGIAAPRIAVSGLNPHASEDGLFGSEEKDIIAPAVAIARARHIDAEGPFGADTMFTRPGYDAFVVMVHDQGHIMAKTHAPAGSAALTIGTPVLFSSVAHGSALDIAGQNKAQPDAMIEAVRRVTGAA
ncbi:MAG TPA: 4-hydroxythreonine-4-phosphate dehydrogenase PdxA [Alphaproteobacteria bacterium]